jgi:transposase InsO family protein
LLLRVDEVEAAGKEILRCVQHCSFSDGIKALQTNSTTAEECNETKKYSRVKKSSPLSKLDPVWQNGLLLVGGRLQAASIPDNAKRQVILPKNNHVADIIIRHYHHISGHLGREYVLALIRRKFWIIQANSAVRKVLSKCVECRKRKAEVLNQKMADLPEDHLISDQPPFTYVGIDYFGPFHVCRGRSLVKRYGAIFTCLTIRAVHIEVSHSLDTDSFLLALRRFLARRGQVKEIRSDNGTKFTSGEKELHEAVGNWNQAKIHDHLLQRNIKWLFNPPYGSHHGGIWERCIRTARNILRALLKEQVVDDESLHTLMCEVEAIMNGRPITKVSDDARDPNALTPNHLLLAQSNPIFPPGVFTRSDVYSKRRWRQIQYLTDIFWKRWTREYLPLLQERQKWLTPKRNVAVGDIVLLVDYSSPRNYWPMGRVLNVFPDKKGLVRSVRIQTKFSVFERPIDKLVLVLEAD